MRLTITLPWPMRKLWPNAQPRNHFAISRLRKTAGQQARILINNALQFSDYTAPPEGDIPVRLTFCMPHKNTPKFDQDNAQAAMKGQLDQLAAALGVNDSRFRLTPITGARDSGDGMVIVEIGP